MWQTICQSLITLAAFAAVCLLAGYLRTRLSAEEMERAEGLVCRAVQAAEQIFAAPGSGNEKLQYAMSALAKAGVRLAPELLRMLIEAAVRALV